MFSPFAVLLSAAVACTSASPAYSTTASTPIVTVKNGSYTGIHNAHYNQDFFLGVPYAYPPVNDLRYRVAQSLNTTWTDTKAATAYPPFCVGYGGDNIGKEQSEDCLYLNVIKPSTAVPSSGLPVAVWIHGGGLFMGGTNDARYNLSFIVDSSVQSNTPMIGVSIQYRLSGWGFLGGNEVLEGGIANLGFRDQRLALHWINENIAAFGGDPSKVTIWGESAGGQSVGAQLLAYNGRDDKLFRSAIAESGGPGVSFFPSTVPGGYNSTAPQTTYNTLVSNTSCASTLNTSSSLSCLRSLPFAELNAALNVSTIGNFVPILDNDFISTYPSLQLSNGNFVKVPLIIGSNTEEGTAFGSGYNVSTDAEFLAVLAVQGISPNSTEAAIISAVYPNVQALGIPSLTTYPELIPANFSDGAQYRRVTSYFGDLLVNSPRRASNHAWSIHNVPSYSYRFDVKVNGIPPIVGATHFQEVVFVFDNVNGEGYAVNPFGNLTQLDERKFKALATEMSGDWVRFVVSGCPGKEWPVYDVVSGGGEGRNRVFSVNGTGSYVEADTYRAEGMKWIRDNSLGVYGT